MAPPTTPVRIWRHLSRVMCPPQRTEAARHRPKPQCVHNSSTRSSRACGAVLAHVGVVHHQDDIALLVVGLGAHYANGPHGIPNSSHGAGGPRRA